MIDKKYLEIIKKILQKSISNKSYKVFIFGSRVMGKNRKFSDIDLGILGTKPLSAKEFITIKDKFDESDLPYRVDLVDFSNVSERFKHQALNNIINIWPKSLN